MDRILAKLKEIPAKILAWWKSFTKKQKIVIGGVSASVIIALVILAVVLTRPTYETLVVAESTAQASSIKELLDSDSSIDYKIMDDDLTFKVNKDSETTAKYLLGTNDIVTDDYTLEDVVDGSFSTTEADKTKKYQLYLEKQLEEDLASMDYIDTANVNLSIPVDDGTILARNEDTYASVTLKLNKELEEGQAEGLAKYIATAVGDDSTKAITILDNETNVLFSGGDDSSTSGAIAKQQDQKKSEASRVKSEIRSVMLGTDVFDNVEVGLNLNMDFSSKTTHDKKYSVADGRDEGYLTSKDLYESETTGGVAGVPGTDSNDDDTTYVIDDNGTSSSTISDSSEQYALNSTETDTVDVGGTINYDSSSATIVAITYKYYNEDALKKSGKLGDKSFDEFVSENSERTQIDVPEDYVTMVAKATGFTEDNISVVAYEVPYFEYSDGSARTVTDYVEIALAVLIFALLGYVVFRSTRPEKTEELEPEISVESLLESTKASNEELADIGFQEKSETRILIEKFVEDKPEAAAALLRNWLEEDWE
ncbi:MAG: flagellar biosynthesis protein [Lachnospiraceae bacterium]|nr:flagellar biosynthesis protein [Lachnospiraceae bacterium]